MPTISVVTPFLDHPELLEGWATAVQFADEVIAIDNGSAEPVRSLLPKVVRKLPCGLVLRNETNRGFAFANNQGLRAATSDLVLFLNSDVRADPRWLEQVRSDVPQKTLVGTSLPVQLVYGMWLPYLEGWCIAGWRDELNTISGWDEEYAGPYWEDNDLCFRFCQQGPGYGLRKRAWQVQHLGAQTIGGADGLMRNGESFERNRQRFAECVYPFWRASIQARVEAESGG